jgi:hypothetical protein
VLEVISDQCLVVEEKVALVEIAPLRLAQRTLPRQTQGKFTNPNFEFRNEYLRVLGGEKNKNSAPSASIRVPQLLLKKGRGYIDPLQIYLLPASLLSKIVSLNLA